MFRRPKIAKREQPDKTPYTLYHEPPSPEARHRAWTQDYHQVVSMDPAYKNLAFRVERRYFDGRIIPLVFERVDLTSGVASDAAEFRSTVFDNLTLFLDRFADLWHQCHIVIIERQLPENYKAVRISQHALSYFLFRMADSPLIPLIAEIEPTLKSRQLQAPRGLNKDQIKDWSVTKAKYLLTCRNDQASLGIMEKNRKKPDDLADTICQIEAVFDLWGLPTTKEPAPVPEPKIKPKTKIILKIVD